MRGAFAIAAVMALAPAPAIAQAYQCRIPRGPVSVPAITPDGPAQRAAIAGYTLAASWSPEYCRTRRASAADRRQCSGGEGRFGFILHGLWPEGRAGAWPQWCPARSTLSPVELARNLCVTPSAELLAHEWAKHGACMARTPESYFATARLLWNGVRWPDFDRLARADDLTAGQVREALAQANRLLEPEDIGLLLNERGWLQELRLCYGKDFKPVACAPNRFGPPDSAPVKIWRGL